MNVNEDDNEDLRFVAFGPISTHEGGKNLRAWSFDKRLENAGVDTETIY